MNHETHKTGTSQRLTRLGIPIALAMLTLPTVALGNAVQWTEAEGGNGHWYSVIVSADMNDMFCWTEARDNATQRGGHLGTLTSETENAFIQANLPPATAADGSYTWVWIGAFQDADDQEPGEFTWVTGEPWDWTYWGGGAPSNDGGAEDFAHTDGESYGTWNDMYECWTGHHMYAYMIEFEADCNGDGIVDYGQILSGALDDADGNGVPDCCDAGTLCVAEITVDDDLMDLPDADFTSIQEAVDAASDGAVIIVAPGTYLPEPEADYLVEVGAKQIQIMALNSNQPPVLDANGNSGFVRLSGHHDAGTRIDGLVMTGHSWTDGLGYGGDWIRVESGSGEGATIANCQFLDNVTGHGIRANWHLTLEGCLFSGNQLPTNADGDYSGYLIYFNYHASTVRNCVFDGNHTSDAMFFAFANTPTYEDCVFKGNTFDETPIDEPGFMVARSGHQIINNCEFMNNQGQSCVINSGDVGNSYFCGNSWGTGPCGSWTDLGGNTFSDGPCFLDCNGNGVEDDVDIASGTSQDCNNNDIPDECDIAEGLAEDCNLDGVPDSCQALSDCDADGIPDACEILNGAADMNPSDGIPDDCQGAARGACCIDTMCVLTTASDCFDASGSYAGDGVSCTEGACGEPCPGDIDGNGIVDVIDILTVLNNWGGCP